jgi:hypothetical protein
MTVVGRLDQYGSMIITGEFDETTANSPSITGFGTYYASEFFENVGVEVTLTANVFMRQNTDKSVIVYNEINEIGFDPYYEIIVESSSINEGGVVTLTIFATNVPDGTEIYYEIV